MTDQQIIESRRERSEVPDGNFVVLLSKFLRVECLELNSFHSYGDEIQST